MTGKDFSKRLDICLRNINQTRKSLTMDLGISSSTMSSWSASKGSIPKADVVEKIAKYLNVSTDWLITGEDPQGLTEEERRLVDDWRELGADARKAVRAVLDTFVAESFEEKKVQAGKA